jgi:hypothetical protein
MYRVWYWLNGELWLVPCGVDAGYAWRVLTAYYPDRKPWLEYYLKDKDEKKL